MDKVFFFFVKVVLITVSVFMSVIYSPVQLRADGYFNHASDAMKNAQLTSRTILCVFSSPEDPVSRQVQGLLDGLYAKRLLRGKVVMLRIVLAAKQTASPIPGQVTLYDKSGVVLKNWRPDRLPLESLTPFLDSAAVLSSDNIILTQLRPEDKLQPKDKEFVNQKGRVVQLRGLNWAEGVAFTKNGMKECAEWGVNLVRCWCSDEDLRTGAHIDEAIEWGREYGVYVLPVIGTLKNKAANKSKPWVDIESEFAITGSWERFVVRCGGNPALLGVELWNEPSADNYASTEYVKVCQRMIAAIHAKNANVNICISAHEWSNINGLTYRLFDLRGAKIFYTFHFYSPHYVTHQESGGGGIYPGRIPEKNGNAWNADDAWMSNEFSKVIKFRSSCNAPVLLGEFGCKGFAPGNTARNWMSDVIRHVEGNRIPWAFWSYKSERGFSFHLYYNETDKKSPPDFLFWDDAFSLLAPCFRKNN